MNLIGNEHQLVIPAKAGIQNQRLKTPRFRPSPE
jgi:hypothetical protein